MNEKTNGMFDVRFIVRICHKYDEEISHTLEFKHQMSLIPSKEMHIKIIKNGMEVVNVWQNVINYEDIEGEVTITIKDFLTYEDKAIIRDRVQKMCSDGWVIT